MRRVFSILLLLAAFFQSYASADAYGDEKVFIACYSRTGNTRAACEVLQKELGAELMEVRDLKNRHSSLGIIGGIIRTFLGLRTRIYPETVNMDEYDLIILASPVWVGRLTPAMRTFIKKNEFEGKKTAVFITSDSFIDERYRQRQVRDVEKQGCSVAGYFQVNMLKVEGDEKIERDMVDVLKDARKVAEKIRQL